MITGDDEDLTIRMERAGFEAPGRNAFFLNKAKEAEDSAATAEDGETRDNWLKIAEGYRNLAAMPKRGKL